MARNQAKTSYTQASLTPSARKPPARLHDAFAPLIKEPKGLSPLAQYIEDNLDSGIPVLELVEQFQEFDCEHPNEVEDARSPVKFIFTCPECGRVRSQPRPGV